MQRSLIKSLYEITMKIAFVFPGQGSQSVGMLDVVSKYPQVNRLFDQANDVLGQNLLQMVNEGPAELLNQTQWTQPALLIASVAIFQVIQQRFHIKIDIMAGHSLGEYSALVCAGVLDFSEAVRLVHLRGQFMQQAVPVGTGSMAAVLGLSTHEVKMACSMVNGVVSPANDNAPGQIVISGEKFAVEAASALCQEKGAKVIPLAVSVPSHCELMRPAAERLGEELKRVQWHQARIPVLHNYDVQSHQDIDAIQAALKAQLYSPVRWTETMQTMQSSTIDTVAECGPGKVLSGLFKRFDRSLNVIPLFNDKGIEKLLGEKG